MSAEPDSLVLQLLRDMRAEMGDMRTEMGEIRSELKADIQSFRADVAADMRSFRAEVASDLLTEHKQTRAQIVGLRRAVIEYHTTTIGHGS